jgi:hypothetical protein
VSIGYKIRAMTKFTAFSSHSLPIKGEIEDR